MAEQEAEATNQVAAEVKAAAYCLPVASVRLSLLSSVSIPAKVTLPLRRVSHVNAAAAATVNLFNAEARNTNLQLITVRR